MTQGDRTPQRFERGQRLSAAALNSLVDAVTSILERRMGRSVRQPLNLLCVLQGDLFAAVDWKTDPSTTTAIVARKVSGDYMLTTETITVTNRFENISLDAGTLVGVEWIDGEWQPYKADCTPQSESVPSASLPSDFFVPDLGGPSV
jgi:hypothetical protein